MEVTRLRVFSTRALLSLCLGAIPLQGVAGGQAVRDAVRFGEAVVCLGGDVRFLAWDAGSGEFKPELSAELSKAKPARIGSNGSRIWGVREKKLKWFERFHAHAASLLEKGGPVVLAGDYNVIPTERDVYKPERWVDDALFLPETREAYLRLLAQGWTDALRHLHPDETIYTFWDYMRGAFSRNVGLRIDHLLLGPALAPRLKAAGVDRDIRAIEKTSDHAPTWVEVG
jgi:hypothetical protein